MLVSIAVPIYNTPEALLSRCVDSLIRQTCQNLEIILVDDGSKDDCGRMCDEYAEKDTRIKVVHKSNGGEASARNAGLRAASGEFVGFCDSDDEYPENAVSALVEAVNSGPSVDLAIGSYLLKTMDGTRLIAADREHYTAYQAFLEAALDSRVYGSRYIFSTVNGKLFRREIICRHNICFMEKLRNGGNDSIFVRDYLAHCADVQNAFVPAYVYYKYDVRQVVQATAYLCPDMFLFHYHIHKKELGFICSCSNCLDTELHAVYQRVMSALIGSMVLAAAYESEFPYSLEKAVAELIETDLVTQAVQHYKPIRVSDSTLIPKYILEKDLQRLMAELRKHAEGYAAAHGGRQKRIRLIYPYDSNNPGSLLPI